MQEGSDGTGASPRRVGARLAEAREALGLSLEDIASRTRVPKRHLAVIEQDGTEGLPATPYSVGFVRSYARAVGLDPEAAAQEFRGRLNDQPASGYVAPEPYEPADPARVPPRWLAIVAVAAAIVIAIGYAAWRNDGLFGGGNGDRARVATAPSDVAPRPVATPSATPAATQALTTGLVSLTASTPVWVRIYEMNGPTLFQGEMKEGQRFEVPVAAVDPRIRTGLPQALTVRVGERELAPLGPPERIVSDVSLKADALLARPETPAPPSASVASPASGGNGA